MIKKLEVPNEYKKYISITLCLTSECNYKCWYCYQNAAERKTEVDYKDCIKFVKQVQEKYPEKEILVLLMGGETLFYKDINDVIEELYNMGIKIDVTTNGSKPEKWWVKYGHMINNLTISYHHKEVDEDEFINKCKIITSNLNRHVSIALMLEPKYFDEIYKVARRLVDEVNNLMIMIKPIENSLCFKDFQYFTTEQNEYILKNRKFKSKIRKITPSPFDLSDVVITEQNGNQTTKPLNEVILRKETNFKGMKCYAGIEEFFMNFDGSIYRANCLIDKLGNVSEDLILPNKPIICDREECYCRIDVQMTKEI